MKTQLNKIKVYFFALAFLFGFTLNAQVTTYPHKTDFESGFGDWKNVLGDQLDFTHTVGGGTPSTGTGPQGIPPGANSSDGYVYIESSSPVIGGDQAWLECIYDFSSVTSATFTFQFYMYNSNNDAMGPGVCSLDIWNGSSWDLAVWKYQTGALGWQTAVVDLSAYAGLPSITLSFTAEASGWQSDISLDEMMLDATTNGGGGPTPCATIPYNQDFETGTTSMTATTGTQSSATIDSYGANSSSYGLHMAGNASSGWSSSYSTGALAFANSPTHIASVSREICASTEQTVTLTFDIKQTYSYNATYSWFRLTVDGAPVADDQGNTYYSATSGDRYGTWKTLTYDLSAYNGQDMVVAWEGCMKYSYGYYYEGDNIYIDNISLTESTNIVAPSAPGTITGTDYPNEGQTGITYSVVAAIGVDTYTWSFPSSWTITAGQGSSSVTVTAGSSSGNISVVATNTAGSSAASLKAVKSAALVTSYPYETAFENEVNDVTTASATGFTFAANGWRNTTGDDGDWRTDAGGTGSTNTGPGGGSTSGAADHYPGTSSGKYLYVESSSPNFPSKEFYLLSPPFDLSSLSVPTLTFWYSMYAGGGSSPTLALQYSLDNGSIWSNNIAYMCTTISPTPIVSGDMGSNWRQGFVDLSSLGNSTNIMFRFVVTTGSSYDSDVCLDDIKLVCAASTSISVGENLELGSSAYSNSQGLVLNGTAAQTITSNGHSVENITINNSNGVTLNGGDLQIDGTLTLTSGIFNTGSNKVTISNTAANAISGGSTTAYINGNLRRHLASNTDTYAFPIGNGTNPTNYQRADLINGNLAGVTYIDASTKDMESGNLFDINTSQSGTMLVEVYDKQWTLTPDAQPSGGTYGVNLYLNGVGGTYLSDNTFTIVKRDENSSSWADWDTYSNSTTTPQTDQPGRTLASGYGQKTGFTSFSDFGFGGGGGGALPIVLLDWDAEVVGESTSLTWSVASQINNDYYTIHKSLDCENWEEVARVPGAGNSNQHMDYHIFDEDPYIGQSYYRLMQTDYDGNYEMFNPVGVFYDKPIALSINPNPVKEVLTLYLSETLRGVTHVTIFNTEGKRIYGKSFVGDWKVIELDVADYKKGYYLLDVDHNRRKGQLKFIKE